MGNEIKLFNDKQIRTVWDNDIEDYYFSIVDVIEVLTESTKPRDYWYRLKKREKENGDKPLAIKSAFEELD